MSTSRRFTWLALLLAACLLAPARPAFAGISSRGARADARVPVLATRMAVLFFPPWLGDPPRGKPPRPLPPPKPPVDPPDPPPDPPDDPPCPPDDPPNHHNPEPSTLAAGALGGWLIGWYCLRRRRRP